MISLEQFMILIALSIIPIIYTSAGFAGGSAFVATLLLLGLRPSEASFYGLIFNSVSASASLLRWRTHLERRMTWYIVGALPLSFLGGQLKISDESLRVVLASAIIISGVFLALTSSDITPRRVGKLVRVFVGALIGLLAGLTGIGGGVYLSPFLVISGDASPKQTAATTTVFILLNSLSGLLGRVSTSNYPPGLNVLALSILPLIVSGALVGSFLGSRRLNQIAVRRLMGVILITIGTLIFVLQ